MSRAELVRRRLQARFSPLELQVDDESALHAGHAGAAGGESHFRVRITAEAFRGLAPLARHRLVYETLAELLHEGIHALTIDARAPGAGGAARAPPAGPRPLIWWGIQPKAKMPAPGAGGRRGRGRLFLCAEDSQ